MSHRELTFDARLVRFDDRRALVLAAVSAFAQYLGTLDRDGGRSAANGDWTRSHDAPGESWAEQGRTAARRIICAQWGLTGLSQTSSQIDLLLDLQTIGLESVTAYADWYDLCKRAAKVAQCERFQVIGQNAAQDEHDLFELSSPYFSARFVRRPGAVPCKS